MPLLTTCLALPSWEPKGSTGYAHCHHGREAAAATAIKQTSLLPHLPPWWVEPWPRCNQAGSAGQHSFAPRAQPHLSSAVHGFCVVLTLLVQNCARFRQPLSWHSWIVRYDNLCRCITSSCTQHVARVCLILKFHTIWCALSGWVVLRLMTDGMLLAFSVQL